ncbi:MAG: DUF4924 family protein [Flavobacteriales bacterium]|nr:MAG: DUF4924 family protein [Flavobacteriales bacterium]
MLIAQKKKKENIAEYILYLFQIEDVVRSFKFDVDDIMEVFVLPNLPDRSFEGQYRKWYQEIITEMKVAKLEKKGHIDRIMEVFRELVFLHNTLYTMQKESKYKTLCENAAGYIPEYRSKSDMKNNHDIEVIIHAMYMKLQLRMRGKEITAETEEAFDAMRIQIAFLVREYHKMKSGDYTFNQN